MSEPTAPDHALTPPLSEAAAEKPGPAEPVEKANREAAAENLPKRKRGRPRSTPPEWDKLIRQIGDDDDYTRRTNVKRFQASMARNVLERDEQERDFTYLTDPEKTRWEVLAELSRFRPADILKLADLICRERMKVKAAVAMLRGLRSDGPKAGSIYHLANEIIRKINDYRSRYPAMSHDQVMDALQVVTGTVGQQDDGASTEAS